MLARRFRQQEVAPVRDAADHAARGQDQGAGCSGDSVVGGEGGVSEGGDEGAGERGKRGWGEVERVGGGWRTDSLTSWSWPGRTCIGGRGGNVRFWRRREEKEEAREVEDDSRQLSVRTASPPFLRTFVAQDRSSKARCRTFPLT